MAEEINLEDLTLSDVKDFVPDIQIEVEPIQLEEQFRHFLIALKVPGIDLKVLHFFYETV